MAEATVKSVLGKISEGHLECPICTCRFNKPKLLDCQHSFCLGCLEQLVSNQEPGTDSISCPVCRGITTVPSGGLQALSNSLVLSSLVDEFNKQEQLLVDAAVTPPACEGCDEALRAVSRCLDCNQNVCRKCKEAHEHSEQTKSHRFVALEGLDLEELPAETAKKSATPKCEKHKDNEVSFYCDTCKILMCAYCAARDHRTAIHKCSEIAEAADAYRQQVREVCQKFDQNKIEMNVLEDLLEHSRSRLGIMVARAYRDIATKEEEQIAQIQYKSSLLRAEVSQLGKEREELYERVIRGNREQLNRVEKNVATVNTVLKKFEDHSILNLRQKIDNMLKPQTPEIVHYWRSFIGVKCTDVVAGADMGKILREEKWSLERTFGKGRSRDDDSIFRHGVACFSTGDIAVIDSHQEQLMIFTSSGHYRTTLAPQTTREGQLCQPFGVAVTYDDFLLVTDGENVKVFDIHLKLVRQFRPSNNDSGGSFKSQLSGIDVDSKKRVAVADILQKTVYLNSFDGSLIAAIPTTFLVQYLAFSCKEQLVYTGFEDRRMLCVDLTGAEVFSVSLTALGRSARPTGMCCDDAGDIYVGVVYDRKRSGCEVHHYTPTGIHLGCIASRLYSPSDMTFSGAGNLVVADGNSVKVFQRV